MNFKKPKQQVIDEAAYAASGQIYHAIGNIKNGYMNEAPNSMLDQLAWGIEAAVRSAVKSIVENTYTDQEFEEDLNLKDKQ